MIPVRAYFNLLTDYLRPLRPRVVLLSFVLFGTIGLQLVNPQLIKRFIDGALEGRGASALIPLAVTFMLVALAQQALAIWATYLAEDVGWTATNHLRANLTEHVIHLDMGFHKGHSSGELIERIDGDVTALSNFFSAMMIKVVGNGALVVGVLVMLWLESWIVGLSVTIFTVLALVAMTGLHRVAVPRWKAVRASAAEAFGFVGEVVEGTEDITANGAAPYMEERFNTILRRWLPQTIRGWMGWAWMWSTTIVLYGLSTSIVFILGSWLFGIGTLTIGSVYLVFHYVEMTRHPMEQIRAQMEDLQKAGAAISRVDELMETPTKLRAEGDQPINGGALRVEFDDVTFSYADEDGAEIVLHDVHFDIAPGRVVGLLGRTGSGKSTIARLITRLYEPQTGTVRLGGVATGDARVADFRKRVGMVTQDVQLFRASVRDNLTFFNDEIPEERILDAIHRLELDPWLASLPDGLDTLLESGSGGLSAGQAQLLAFTRIFLEDPGVVVLDEASSRLDPATEALIERAVDHLLEGRTGIVIAHRLGTVTRADDILILDDGHVVEFGERSTLAADPDSRFSDLLATGMEEVLA
ncbi:MAG: ABC transporter ATP-binding protein/permease [Actinomycetia bacterium]|nr:ABC transporter ATP-binding protein/permease [Actinomycetes bacterium]